jgi:hypothetical protein
VPDGAEIAGRTQIDNHAAIIRGPFLRNPAFAQPSGGNGAALRLGRTTFRGRFADQPRRLQHRTAVIGWIGPLFWPFAYSDFIDYTFWPYAYDSFWPRAYDDVYEGIFGPYVVGASDVPDVNVPLSSPGSGSPNAPQAETDLAQICAERRSGLTEWPIERIAQVVEPDDAQRSALSELKDATAQAVTRLLSACPTQLPSTPTGRLAAMRMRLEIMLQAVEIVQPALDKFYQLLNDEQKARQYRRSGSAANGRRSSVGKRARPRRNATVQWTSRCARRATDRAHRGSGAAHAAAANRTRDSRRSVQSSRRIPQRELRHWPTIDPAGPSRGDGTTARGRLAGGEDHAAGAGTILQFVER